MLTQDLRFLECSMIQAHVYISGFVQGVGYRQFVKRKAQDLGLRGFVKNLPARHGLQPKASAGGPDARVEAVFQGKKEDIEKMITLCKKGPFLAEVEDIHIIWEESQEVYRDFTIV